MTVFRYFAPVAGIDEDPVTGSIHTAIAPLWAEKLAKIILWPIRLLVVEAYCIVMS